MTKTNNAPVAISIEGAGAPPTPPFRRFRRDPRLEFPQ